MADLPPLSPPAGAGRSIAPTGLQWGDIIVSTTDAKISELIRDKTDSPVSHSMMYIGDGQVVEAAKVGFLDDRVVVRPMEEALADASLAVAYRNSSMTPEQALIAVASAVSHEGADYDFSGVVWAASPACGRWADADEFFCSELVTAAFAEAGLDLTGKSPECSTPDDIVKANSYVGHLRDPAPEPSSVSETVNEMPFITSLDENAEQINPEDLADSATMAITAESVYTGENPEECRVPALTDLGEEGFGDTLRGNFEDWTAPAEQDNNAEVTMPPLDGTDTCFDNANIDLEPVPDVEPGPAIDPGPPGN